MYSNSRSFSLSLRLKKGVDITDPGYTIDLNDIGIYIATEAKPAMLRRIRERLSTVGDFNKVSVAIKSPQVFQVFDLTTATTGEYTPGGPIEIRGAFLDLPPDLATDLLNGVFFSIGGVETRAAVYISDGDRKIVCMVPATVTGSVDIIVRSDYGGPNLREGQITGISEAIAPPP